MAEIPDMSLPLCSLTSPSISPTRQYEADFKPRNTTRMEVDPALHQAEEQVYMKKECQDTVCELAKLIRLAMESGQVNSTCF